ncbi:MAG TPA: hypothetical protein P5111_11555 [Kiritimatiellia bacterium]|nr:hypothetical protein [Kiritimatiellia bacterium]
MLTGFVTPVVLAVVLLAFASLHDGSWEPGMQVAGICRELLAGTTQGRQALFGSCWSAPLPVLVYLPFAWLLPEPLAGWTAFFVAWLFAFWTVREAVKASGHSGWRIVLAQAAIAGMVVVARQPQALQLTTPLTAGLVLLAASSLADWAAFRRLRDVVATGAAGSFLMLCGFPFFAPAGVAVALVPLMACGDRESRQRVKAWVLLGCLPLLYTTGVWLLMNRLILGDALFFLRSLHVLVANPVSFTLAVLLPGAVLLPALIMTWLCDAQRSETGAGPHAATVILISFALMFVGTTEVLGRFGLAWDSATLHVCFLAVLMIALARLRQPIYRLAVTLALFVWLTTLWLGHVPASATAQPRDKICRGVEEYVTSRTAYGRVFALGYAGLDLLRDYTGERLVANMDLHVGALRRAYKGQNLYVLVPRPEGPARAESVFWKHPDIYRHGGDRLLFAGAFGTWHLFEIISAPTQEQLDEWKKAGSQ